MIVNNLLKVSRASRFLPGAHPHLPSAIVGQMIRKRRKVKVNRDLKKKVCSAEPDRSDGPDDAARVRPGKSA